jgi:hypothetical protein
MTLKSYPSFLSDKTLMEDLRRVAQLRSDDANIVTALQDESTYKQGFYPNVREVSASTTVGKFDYHIEGDTTAGSITITLPNDEKIGCREIVISKKVAGNQITVDGNGKNINGSATHAITTLHKCHCFHYLPAADEWRILWG